MLIGSSHAALLNEYAIATAEEVAATQGVLLAGPYGEEAVLAAVTRMEEAHAKKMKLHARLQEVSLDKK